MNERIRNVRFCFFVIFHKERERKMSGSFKFVLNFLMYIRKVHLKAKLPSVDINYYDHICNSLTEQTCEPNMVRRRRVNNAYFLLFM